MKFNPEWLNRPRKRSNPEGHLVLQCIKYLRIAGYNAYKIKTQGTPYKNRFIFDPYRLTGLPDILAWKSNKELLAIECKAKSKQTPNQIFFQNFWHYPPSRVYTIIHSIEELEKIIK